MMESYRVIIKIPDDGTIVIRGLPFNPGDDVELIVRRHDPQSPREIRIPLRIKPVCCVDSAPAAGTNADGDWTPLR
jgi:hypothetical protein